MRPTLLLALPALCALGSFSLAAPRAPLALDDEAAQALLDKAEELARKGKYKEARRAYEKLLEEYPDSPLAPTAERRSKPSAFVGWADVVRNGPSSNRIDVVMMGEGYELKHQKMFDKTAKSLPPYYERQGTFGEYYSYFNFLRANLVSAESGVDGFGREYDTALNGKTLSTYAGHVGVDYGTVRAMLDELPEHDGQAIVFARLGVLGTGGGGVATIGGTDVDIVLHEFGHSFAGLGDEYTSETHKRGSVRNNVNVADTGDPEKVAWAHWIAAGAKDVGVYEGAAGQARDAWKPTPGGCVMDSGEFFCRPCREEVVLDIYRVVDPIDSCEPAAHGRRDKDALTLVDALLFTVQVMQPKSHDLEVRWWVLPEADVPQGPSHDPAQRYERRRGGRAGRGPLPTIPVEPRAFAKKSQRGGHTFELRRADLAPGRYRVLCRANDTTVLRGEKWPWVLRDEDGVLESERGWWVVVD